MKLLKCFLIISLGFIASCSTGDKASNFSPLKNFKEQTLSNGIHVLYVKEDKLPYLSFSLMGFTGSASDPKGMYGVTAATVNLLTKGTQLKSAVKLNEEIETLGADLDTTVEKEFFNVSLEGLSWYEDKLLSLFSEILLKPKFTSQELSRYKERTSARIQQSLDQASYLASEILENKLYQNHPFGHREIGTLQGIQNITVKSLANHYERMLSPKQLWIVVVGKYSDALPSKIEAIFSKVKASQSLNVSYPELQALKGKNILIVDKPDAAQAEIRIGHYGIMRSNSDYQATSLANSILGQGFTSRLVDRIRDQLGLTYNISSGFDVRKNRGFFQISTFTQNERVGQTLDETLKIFAKFQQEGVTSKELRLAQDYMVGKFPLLLETPEKLAYNLMILRFFGISDDYLNDYKSNVRGVDLKTANQAIQKHFDPENMQIVILGNKAVIESQIRNLGTIENQPVSKFFY